MGLVFASQENTRRYVLFSCTQKAIFHFWFKVFSLPYSFFHSKKFWFPSKESPAMLFFSPFLFLSPCISNCSSRLNVLHENNITIFLRYFAVMFNLFAVHLFNKCCVCMRESERRVVCFIEERWDDNEKTTFIINCIWIYPRMMSTNARGKEKERSRDGKWEKCVFILHIFYFIFRFFLPFVVVTNQIRQNVVYMSFALRMIVQFVYGVFFFFPPLTRLFQFCSLLLYVWVYCV